MLRKSKTNHHSIIVSFPRGARPLVQKIDIVMSVESPYLPRHNLKKILKKQHCIIVSFPRGANSIDLET